MSDTTNPDPAGQPAEPQLPAGYPPQDAYPPAQPGYPIQPAPYPPAAGAYPPPAAPASPTYGAPPAYSPPGAYATPPAYAPQAPYGAASSYSGGYGAAPKTNTLAVVSLIASIAAFVVVPFVGSVVGVITGHMSLSQISRTGEGGRGLGLAGTIIGWVGLGLALLGIILLAVALPLFLVNVRSTIS